jgi:hypothetical protein
MKRLMLLIFAVASLHLEASEVLVQKENFLELEVDAKDIWVACSDFVNNEDGAILGFNAIVKGRNYEFLYRGVLSIKQCREDEDEYRKIIKMSKKVKIVGISLIYNYGPSVRDKRIPERFSQAKDRTTAIFIRLLGESLETAKSKKKVKCKAYFKLHCDLPKNYWSGVIPDDFSAIKFVR